MKTFMLRILVLSALVGVMFLTADIVGGATSKTSSPKRPDKSPKRSNSGPKRSDRSSSRTNSTPTPAVKGVQGFDLASFKIITDRNIFNSNRSAGRSRGDEKGPAKVESFALTGTLAYEKGTFAFFDGSSAEYRKVLKPQATIAGYKITEIAPNAAKLQADDQTVEMRVGMQMRREDEGEWKLSASPVPPPSSSPSSSSRFSSSSGSSSSRFSGSTSSSSRFGGSNDSSRFGSDRGSSSRFSGGPDSNSRFSDNRGPSSGSNSGSQGSSSSSSSSGVSKEEALRRLMEQRARERQ